METISIDDAVRLGAEGNLVRVVQEWLTFARVKVPLDGLFDSRTAEAVVAFQRGVGLPVTGEVDPETFDALVAPLVRAIAPIAPGDRSLAELVLAWAEQQLAESPLDVGGRGMGPWARLYGDPRAPGADWSTGFVTFCLRRACDSLGLSLPVAASLDCGELVVSAMERGAFVTPSGSRGPLVPGSLFCVHGGSLWAWLHCGIVRGVGYGCFTTIEAAGQPDGGGGARVCSRARDWAEHGFITLDAGGEAEWRWRGLPPLVRAEHRR